MSGRLPNWFYTPSLFKDIITEGETDMSDSKDTKMSEESKALHTDNFKSQSQRKALDLLDDAKTFHKADSMLLRGDGLFQEGQCILSPFEVLQRYHKLARIVERAYIHVHNSI